MSTPTLSEPAHLNMNEKSRTPTIVSDLTMPLEDPTTTSPKLEAKEEGQLDHDELLRHPLSQLSPVRKHVLLFIFAIATFLDICNVSGVAVAVAQISSDIHLEISQIVWIITSYSLCFSAFLLFSGRLADLFRAQFVFLGGFIALGILSLVTSWVTSNKYGFLILRGLGGIAGAMTIPASMNLVVRMFPDSAEQQKKLALLSIAGGVGNVLGLVIAGVCMLLNYQLFFRVVGAICLLFSIMTFFLLPFTALPRKPDPTPRWRRLDLVGTLLMMGALICFILGLTEGPIEGWGSAAFIAPFIISIFLGVGFFVWEARMPNKNALLPSSVWKVPNVIIGSLAVLIAFPFWATSQLQYATYFQIVGGWSPIHVAAALLPQGLTGLIMGAAVQFFPAMITRPNISIPIGGLLIIAAELLQVFSDGALGWNYWKFFFPASVLGSAGAMLTFFASAINVISYTVPEMSGTIGAWTQVIAQVGGAVCLGVQAGLEGNLADWKQSGARAYYFMIAWTAVLCIQYAVFYRQPGTPEEEHEKTRQRIREAEAAKGESAQ